MVYQNRADEPIDQDLRLILISLSQSLNLCSISILVINIADPPIIAFPPNYTTYYLEDDIQSIPIFNSSLISISDQDNSFLAQVTLNITNLQMGARDVLYSLNNSNFNIFGNETFELNATAISEQLPHQEFLDFVGGITFGSLDQAP